MLGCTFVGKAPDSPKEHLYVIISDPKAHRGEVVIVNLSKQRSDKEQTCIIGPGEHPYVSEESVVLYVYAKKASAALIDEALVKGALQPHVKVDDELLLKIQSGALRSTNVAEPLREMIRNSM